VRSRKFFSVPRFGGVEEGFVVNVSDVFVQVWDVAVVRWRRLLRRLLFCVL
jgi:hypothetical protein